METSPAAKMFHVLVVMGAALGCARRPIADSAASESSEGGSSDASSAAGSSSVATSTTSTSTSAGSSTEASASTAAGTSTAGTSATTTTGAPDDPTDCRHPQQFLCDSYNPPVGCVCDPDAPLSPEDCEETAQFSCADPWFPIGCVCDPSLPTGPEACRVPSAFNCVSYGPVFVDCRCECRSGPPTPQSAEDCADAGGGFGCLMEPFACCCFPLIV